MQRVDTGPHADAVGKRVGVRRAVDLESVLVGSQTVRRKAVRSSTASLRTRGHARHQQRELREVPAVQRQRQNLLRINYRSERGALALDERGLGRYCHRFGDLAHFECHVQADILVDLQSNVVEFRSPEPLQFHTHVIGSWSQPGQIVLALLIGNCLAPEVGAVVHCPYCGAHDNGTR